MSMLNIVIFGPPGAGKGTQSERLIKKYNLVHLSTGDMFRYHISNDTDLGKKVKEIIADGRLVPDSVTIEMLENEVRKHPGAKGFIFDGFPRTVPQAEALDNFLDTKEQTISLVISLEVNQEIIKQRIEERSKISCRVDDAQDKLIKRINEYFEKTIKVLPYYEQQGKVSTVNGIGEIDEVSNRLYKAIETVLVNN